jgi:spermidine synthase
VSGPGAEERGSAGGRSGMARPAALGALVFVVGAASLGVEIAAARLLAPYFGASTIVWANTIGIVLVALSAGYWFGGRVADRNPDPARLGLLVLVAAALIAVVPFAARPFLGFSVEAFEGLSLATFAGSLFGVLILVALPVALLGAVAPWAARLAVGDDARGAGEAVGRLYAISTAGSLVGTMTSALVAIPLLGTQRTFIAFALVLGLVAVLALGRRALPVAAALALALAIPPGQIKETDDRVLYEGETVQQYVRIVEREDGSRAMELNEGQAVHSLWRPGTYLTGDYWDGMVVLPTIGHVEPRKIAILGNAGGTVARAFGHYFPRTAVDAVEIDGELTSLGRKYLGLRNPRMDVFAEDARPWLEASSGGYDAILVDAYRQPYIPFYLTTAEFFALAAERLAPGGVVIVNVGHPKGSDALEQVLGATMATAFPRVLRDPIADVNTLLVGGDAGISAARLEAGAPILPRDLRRLALESSARIGPRIPGGEVYTDDHAPVEWLIDDSLLEYAGAAGE